MPADALTTEALTTETLAALLADLPEDTTADPLMQQRGACRWALEAPAEVLYTVADGAEAKVLAVVRNISMSGIGLISSRPVRVNVRADLRLPVQTRAYRCRVRVAYCKPIEGGYLLGCEFLLGDGHARRLSPASLDRAILGPSVG